MTIRVETVRSLLCGRPPLAAAARDGDRFAAVAAILRERRGEAEVLLIRRALMEGDPWSGHMAFPGGRQDPGDADLLGTAVRETFEEVGLGLQPEREFLGRLDDLPAVARGKRVGMIIAPHVFAVEGDPMLRLNAREVDEVMWVPLTPLFRGERDTTLQYELDGARFDLPAYDVDGRVVWGLTHRMLHALFEILDPARQTSYRTPG